MHPVIVSARYKVHTKKTIGIGLVVSKLVVSKDVRGCPFAPFMVDAIVAWLVINTIVQQTADSTVGLLLLAAGLPFYFY